MHELLDIYFNYFASIELNDKHFNMPVTSVTPLTWINFNPSMDT